MISQNSAVAPQGQGNQIEGKGSRMERLFQGLRSAVSSSFPSCSVLSDFEGNRITR